MSNHMLAMTAEDIHDFIYFAGKCITATGTIPPFGKSWRRHFAEQAWWSLTCILDGHGARTNE